MARRAQLQADRGNPRLKFLDRYVGIPLVALLAVPRRMRGRRPVPEEWNTIGILLTAGIGDAVVATGALRDLRAARPDARIILFVTANNASFARLLSAPDAVIELPVRQLWDAVSRVRAERCDIVVDFGAWRRFDAVLARLSGAHVTIGLATPGQHRHFGYDVVVTHERAHEIENDRRLLATVGIHSVSPPEIRPSGAGVRPIEAPYAVLHLWPGGANFEERSWPIDEWRSLAQALSARGLDVAITGGPEDVAATEALVRDWSTVGIRAHAAAGGTWIESIEWLRFAVGTVSVNTGVMHVSAALGTPTVALNGPTSTTRWGPLGPHTRSVVSPMVPDGYLNLGFEQDERFRECMSAITVESVVMAWDDLQAEVRATS